jgi:hypothetical protein
MAGAIVDDINKWIDSSGKLDLMTKERVRGVLRAKRKEWKPEQISSDFLET